MVKKVKESWYMIFKAGGLGMQVKGQRRGSSENENTENPVIYNQVTT